MEGRTGASGLRIEGNEKGRSKLRPYKEKARR
jgi:hypothetical protein